MKTHRRPATCFVLLMTGSLCLAGCANSSMGRAPLQVPSLSLFQSPPAAGTADALEQPPQSESLASSESPPSGGLGLIQPVSAELAADDPNAIMLPVPLQAVDPASATDVAELTPIVVGGAEPVYEEAYVEEAVYPGGLIGHLSHKGHSKKADRATLVAAGLAGKEAKWKKKERRDIGSHNPYIGRELRMKSHPEYIVEPPDVLYIEALNLLDDNNVMGERLVRQDGTISLGYYGQVHVAGLTLQEIEEKIRERLRIYIVNPKVYVDVAAFNSKVYYVLGQVQQTGRLPVTGKETVLDAVTLAGGLTNFADLRKIHVARPNPGGGCDQILHVDWRALADCGDTRTNYQLLPGDRVVVPGTRGFRTNIFFDNNLTPFERLASLASLLRFATTN